MDKNETKVIAKGRKVETNLWRHVWGLQAELVHDPSSFDAIWSSVPVEHQCFPHPYNLLRDWIHHRTILPRRFPIPRCRCPVGPVSGRVFAVPEAEEVPFSCIQLSYLCTTLRMHQHMTGQYFCSNRTTHD
ncbi:hypothetical protein CR513_15004, partial [Mucuna pruriens]